MSNGDPIRAGQGTSANRTTAVVGEPGPFAGSTHFMAGNPALSPDRVDARVDGIQGFGSARPRSLDGGNGVVGFGAIATGTGVVGVGGTIAGVGVYGVGGNMHSVNVELGLRPAGAGVIGYAQKSQSGSELTSPGVYGLADGNDGVLGVSGVPGHSGVRGFNSTREGNGAGVFGHTPSQQGFGVVGLGGSVGTGGIGNIGVFGRGALAGFFQGNVSVDGDLICTGTKSAAVAYGDGTLRRLYCVESPESWFEDFGESALKRGKAVVKLSADFRRCIGRGPYHVFLTPLGDCNGLYVSSRSAGAFEVRELAGGTRSLKFSYRIVAKRKGTEGKRLEKLALPDVPEALSAKELKALAKGDDQLRVLTQSASRTHLRKAGKPQTGRSKRKSEPRT